MRRGSVILGLLFLIVTPCSAVHSQGLEWKYSEGSRYDFREMYHYGENETTELGYDWIYYLVAPNYSEIDDPLLMDGGVPFRRAMTYWPNGTVMNTGRLSFAVPVGNWSLLSTLLEAMSDDSYTLTAFESYDLWGYEENYASDISSFTRRVEFSKSDGVLTRMTYTSNIFNYHNSFVTERLSISPTVIQLGIAIVAAGSIAIVLVVYHRMKK